MKSMKTLLRLFMEERFEDSVTRLIDASNLCFNESTGSLKRGRPTGQPVRYTGRYTIHRTIGRPTKSHNNSSTRPRTTMSDLDQLTAPLSTIILPRSDALQMVELCELAEMRPPVDFLASCLPRQNGSSSAATAKSEEVAAFSVHLCWDCGLHEDLKETPSHVSAYVIERWLSEQFMQILHSVRRPIRVVSQLGRRCARHRGVPLRH